MASSSLRPHQPRTIRGSIIGAICASVAFAAALTSTFYPTWAKVAVGLGCGVAWADVLVQYVGRRETERKADHMPAATPATVPMLHRFLGIGLMTLAAALLLLKYFGIAPGLRADSVTKLIAYSLSAVAVVLAVVALVVFKRRVPERSAAQSVEDYWSAPEVGSKVLPVWFLLEGAGTLAAVGYFLTGEPVAAVAAGVLIGAFWWHGPNVFAKP
jgi:hypothetical protein